MLAFAAVTVLFYYSYFYADFYETGLEGVRFWDILFAGKIRHFYTQIFLIGNTQYIPLYDFPMYIIFAIWNFPLWEIAKLKKNDIYHSSLCLMWKKSLTLCFTFLAVKMFRRMLADLGLDEEERNTGIWMFLSSGFYMVGLVVLSQYDVICLTIILWAVSEYLRGNDRKSLILFALAAPLKYFGLLVFVPLLLLKEKRISRIILNLVLVMIPCLFFWVMFPYGRPDLLPGCVFSNSSSGTNVGKPVYMDLYDRGQIAFGVLFFFVFGEIIFLLLCYLYKEKEVWKNGKLVMYVCFTAFMIQFTLAYSHPYWQILMVPFTTALILLNHKYRYANLVLEIVYSAFFMMAQLFFFTWCFKAEIVSLSLWKFVVTPGEGAGLDVVSFLHRFITDQRLGSYAVGVGLSIYGAAMLLFCILNWPLRTRELPITGRDEPVPAWVLPLRAAISVVVGVVPLILFFLTWG